MKTDYSINKKVWLEYKGKPILGKGRYNLLKAIKKTSSLKKSAIVVGISEKTAHNYIKKIELRIGKKIVITTKGGKYAGGNTVLNPAGFDILERFEKIK